MCLSTYSPSISCCFMVDFLLCSSSDCTNLDYPRRCCCLLRQIRVYQEYTARKAFFFRMGYKTFKIWPSTRYRTENYVQQSTVGQELSCKRHRANNSHVETVPLLIASACSRQVPLPTRRISVFLKSPKVFNDIYFRGTSSNDVSCSVAHYIYLFS